MSPIHRSIDVGGVETAYIEEGDGRPIVLVHGGDYRAPSHSVDWDLTVSGLAAAGYRAIALDKLGQGGTALPPDPASYTMQAVCDHFGAFLDALQLADVVLVGHSRGVLPVLEHTLEHPGRVGAVVVVDTATVALHEIPEAAEFYREAFAGWSDPPTAEQVDREIVMNSYATDHITPQVSGARLRAASSAKAALARRIMRDGAIEGFLRDVERLREEIVARIAAGELQKDVLITWGRNDPSAPVPLGYELFDLVASPNRCRTELHVFDHSGHYCYREHPTAFTRVVDAFLAP